MPDQPASTAAKLIGILTDENGGRLCVYSQSGAVVLTTTRGPAHPLSPADVTVLAALLDQAQSAAAAYHIAAEQDSVAEAGDADA